MDLASNSNTIQQLKSVLSFPSAKSMVVARWGLEDSPISHAHMFIEGILAQALALPPWFSRALQYFKYWCYQACMFTLDWGLGRQRGAGRPQPLLPSFLFSPFLSFSILLSFFLLLTFLLASGHEPFRASRRRLFFLSLCIFWLQLCSASSSALCAVS